MGIIEYIEAHPYAMFVATALALGVFAFFIAIDGQSNREFKTLGKWLKNVTELLSRVRVRITLKEFGVQVMRGAQTGSSGGSVILSNNRSDGAFEVRHGDETLLRIGPGGEMVIGREGEMQIRPADRQENEFLTIDGVSSHGIGGEDPETMLHVVPDHLVLRGAEETLIPLRGQTVNVPIEEGQQVQTGRLMVVGPEGRIVPHDGGATDDAEIVGTVISTSLDIANGQLTAQVSLSGAIHTLPPIDESPYEEREFIPEEPEVPFSRFHEIRNSNS